MNDGNDTMRGTILADGTIKLVTDAISAANHDNADQFVAAIARLAGGETTVEARDDVRHDHEHHHHEEGHHHHQ